MTPEAFRGSFVEVALERVSGFMGIEHRLGSAEDARVGAPPRIVWVPPERNAIRIAPAPFARPGGEVITWAEGAFAVTFWGESYDAAMTLYTDTWTALDTLFGPPQGRPEIDADEARPGYSLDDPSQITGASNVAGSVALVSTATLRAFIARKRYGTAPIVSVPISVVTTAPSSTVEEPAIP